jgi:serine protease
MKNFLLLSIITVLLTSNLFAQSSSSNEAEKFVFGKLILKLKSEIKVSPTINNEINSSKNHTQFGISSLDVFLSEYKIKDIEQKFPYHNEPKFRSQVSSKFGTNVSTLENIYQINFDESLPVQFFVDKLSKLPEVEYVEPVYIYEEYDEPNDTDYSVLQHLPQIMAEEGWDIAKGEDGAEVVVGICDSGVEWYHPDLIDNLKQNLGEDLDGDGSVIQFNEGTQQWEFDPDDVNGVDDDGNGFEDDFIGWNFAFYTDNTAPNMVRVSEVNAHGTHVAGLAAGVTNNEEGISAISWNVKYLPTKHGSNNGGTQIFSPFEGIVYLAENGADIINMSWGGSPFSNFDKDVIDYAASLGSILVGSAGNGNTIAPAFPASYSGVISVAAVASTDEKSYYSHYGPTIDISSPGGDRYVDGGLLSTLPGSTYGRFQGTSMASPLAAGLFALVKSYFPEKTNDEIIAHVLGTTDDISSVNSGFDNLLGTGRINAYNALTQEPVFQDGLKLSILNTGFYIYDEEVDAYYLSGIAKPNTEGKMELVVKNSNNFYGVSQLNVSVTSDNPDFMVLNQNVSSSIGPDETIYIEIPYTVDENAETGYVNFDIAFNSQDGEIIYGSNATYQAFINGGGVLVWEPVPNGQDMSGMFFKEYYENRGVEVYYTNEVLPSFEGFDAVFCSFGSVSAPDFYNYIGAVFNNMINILNYNLFEPGEANIFIESQNILSHFQGIYGLALDPMWYGVGGFEYDPEVTTIVEDIMGVEGNEMFSDFMFESSSQENSYEMDRFLTGATSSPMLTIPGFGDVVHYGINMFGNQVITSSVSISQLNDGICPSTRENFMRRMNLIFEIFADIEITLDDVETCEGVPVSIGGNVNDCSDEYPIVDYISGGSGYFEFEWYPTYGLDDPYSPNPVVLNPRVTRTYTVHITDEVLGETYVDNVTLYLEDGPDISVPLFVMKSLGEPVVLNDLVTVNSGTPDFVYNWTDGSNNTYTGYDEITHNSTGIYRYYVNVTDNDGEGCPSRTKRVIVFVSWYKNSFAEQFTPGVNGSSFIYTYPNPAVNELKILSEFADYTDAVVQLVDMSGRIINEFNYSNVISIEKSVDVSELASGSYFILINSNDDSAVHKFIKK